METVSSEADLNSILEGNSKAIAVFLADWCPFCRTFKPLFEKNTKNLKKTKCLFVGIEDEENPLWEEYGIEVIPTVIFFEGKKIISRLDGILGQGIRESELIEKLAEVKAE